MIIAGQEFSRETGFWKVHQSITIIRKGRYFFELGKGETMLVNGSFEIKGLWQGIIELGEGDRITASPIEAAK